ncbi:hypothetical protein OQA88_4588 [Cercophora sp. LCS_1]
MDSWAAHTPSPSLKFENSPTESLLSTPDEMYPSLFGNAPAPVPTTLNPLDVMSPKSLVDDHVDLALLSSMSPGPETPAADGTPEKKPVKKRKSWGQVLPEPKTNLPPRKRAKTEDEKEQRRVERVLRNRRAAQSSRERKRQEVEALEQRNKQLEDLLRKVQQDNITLVAELRKFTSAPGGMAAASTPFDALRPSPVTFSQELFSSQDGHNMSVPTTGSLEQLLTTIPTNNTVNPASLSPVLTPVAEEADEESEPAAVAPLAVSVGGSGAVMAGCPAAVAPSASSFAPVATTSDFNFDHAFTLQPTLDADSYVLESELLASPNSSDFEYDHTVGDESFTFTNDFDINDFISDDHVAPTNEQQPQHQLHSRAVAEPSLFNLETQVPAPALARPLMDATAEALRLVSGQGYEVDRVLSDDASAAAAAGDLAKQLKQVGGGTNWLNGARIPSKEVLITLMWVLRAEERRVQIRQGLTTSKLGSPSVLKTAPTASSDRERFVLKVLPKRSLGGVPETVSLKRRRVD